MDHCQEKIYSEDYVDFILDFEPPEETLEGVDYCKTRVDDFISIYHVSKYQVGNLAPSAFRYLYLPKIYGKMGDTGEEAMLINDMQENRRAGDEPQVRIGTDYDFLTESGIASVKEAPLGLSGKGVVIAILDTEVDYASDLFASENGESRIIAYWDQTRPSAEPPEGFGYGTEYRKERDGNIRSVFPTVNTFFTEEHGTALASIAAGKGAYGIAEGAELVVVRLKEAKAYLKEYYCIPSSVPCYEETDLIEAYRYASQFAKLRKRPLAVLTGMGTSFGDHAGGSFLSGYVGRLARKRNSVYVVPAGNEGISGHHYSGQVRGEGYEKAEIRVEEGCSGFFLEIWGRLPDFFETSLRSPSGEEIGRISISEKKTMVFRFLYEKTVVYADTLIAEQLSGQQLTVLRFEAPSPGIWTVYVKRYRNSAKELGGANGEMKFDMYLPLSQFLTAPVYFLTASPYETLSSPVLEENVLNVAAYQGTNGSVAAFSGRGYTLNDRIKPDFAAPGESIPWGGGVISGSSASAAVTAGACALFLEWAVGRNNIPLIGSAEVRNLFAGGCKRERSVNVNLTYPNREWGFGKLNLEGVFELLKNS